MQPSKLKILTCSRLETPRAAMTFEGRGTRAVAVVPQDRQAVVALHEAHRLVRVGSHEQREPGPDITAATEPHFVVPGRDYTPFRQMLQNTGLHRVSITKHKATWFLVLGPLPHLCALA
jgi:hypothetical protein